MENDMTKRPAKNRVCLWYNAKCAFDAMMEMSKINIAAIEAAQRG